MADYIISGAGSGGNFNGTFVFTGVYFYENTVDPNYVLSYDSGISQWTIRHFSDIYYYNNANTVSPPLSGWIALLGLEPVPTISIVPPPKIFNVKNLFLKSNFENSVSLYIKSSVFGLKSLPLYLKSSTQEQTELYIKSFPQKSISLFIKYWYEHQDGQELYLKSLLEASTNLFIKNVYLYTETNNSIDFNIRSSTIDQQINSVELYIKSFFEKNLELFLMVDDTALTTGFIYTYISGDIIKPLHFESLNLYLSNEYISTNESLNITIIGLGNTFNAIPYGSSINMFIQRDIEATWNYMPLITYGVSLAVTNSIDFNIYTKDVFFDSIELIIPQINQPFNETVQLYTHGFED